MFGQSQTGSFTFTLSSTARTSAGVYKTDSTLVRTLWADKTYPAGTYTSFWDGKDDYGNTLNSPNSTYIVKLLTNNVTYTWEGVIGNTSSSQIGSGVHRALYTSMTGMAITGTTAYFCQGYSEAYSSEAKFSSTNPQVRLNIFPGRVSTLNTDYVATDGINVYWAGYDAYVAANSFVHATKVSDDSHVSFGGKGSSYKMQNIGSAITYPSVIDKLNISNSKSTGLAVQQSGSYLFIAHGGLNELHVLNKTTGALVQNISITNPQSLSVEGSSLWMVSGTNTIAKYTVNSNGTLSVATLRLASVSSVGAIQANNAGMIAVVDKTNQVLRFFNTTTGAEGTQLGTNGGYSTSPTVTNTKFFFNDYRGNTNSFIAFAYDGSFWLGDPGNYRELHYSSGKTYIEYIMSLGASYSCSVDPNNINRVFGNYLEFAIDYTKPLAGNTGWTLIRNWGYNSTKNINNWKLLNVVTLSNGRTYGQSYTPGIGYAELTSTGLRSTGVSPGGIVNTDGSVTKVSGSSSIGSHLTFTTYPLTGFDGSGNPIWSASGTVIATTPTNALSYPNVNPGSVFPQSEYNYVTTTNKVIFFNPSIFSVNNGSIPWIGYHLGAISKGGNSWLWLTNRTNQRNYTGSFPEADYFEIGNGGNNFAGSHVNVVGNNIVTGYHGEGWKNGQTNRFNHYNEDGLAIGQFGADFYQFTLNTNIYPLSVPGFAGNALTPVMVKDGLGNLYLYHGDESYHAGLHRWKISNLASIKEQYINVPYPTAYVGAPINFTNLHSGLPLNSVPASNGWSTSGIVKSVTGSKKYVLDGAPDIFTTFTQVSGNASVQRDLGTTNVTASWKISGMLSFESSNVAVFGINSYVDVLDVSGKILARFTYTVVQATKVITIYGNNVIIAIGNLSSTLLQYQPFEVNVVNGFVTFTYANFASITTSIYDPSADWKNPKTFRQYFVGGFPAYGNSIGFMDMLFYKDYPVNISTNYVKN